jgi:hypothetical protein
MKLLITCLSICISFTCFSQTDTSVNYLVIRIDELYDNNSLVDYYVIRAEGGCNAAKEIYGLKAYNNKKKAMNEGGIFYPDKKNSVYPYFNYFHSTTEILNYLSKNGWQLVTIYSDTVTGYNTATTSNGDSVSVPTVGYRPIFCFKKVKN